MKVGDRALCLRLEREEMQKEAPVPSKASHRARVLCFAVQQSQSLSFQSPPEENPEQPMPSVEEGAGGRGVGSEAGPVRWPQPCGSVLSA